MRRARAQEGVILVLTALLMVVILSIAAMAIGMGSFYGAERRAQAAADAGALAGAADLETSTSAVSGDATSLAAVNDPAGTATVSVPNPRQVKVTVNASTPSFFGQALGLTSERVSATAVAGSVGSGMRGAIFAMDSNCSDPGIQITNNSSITVNGALDFNGALNVTGNSSSSLGTTSYNSSCTGSIANNSASSFAAGPTPRANTIGNWPVDYTEANSPSFCTYTMDGIDWQNSGYVNAAPGVYCSTGPVIIKNDTTVTGKVTLIAPSITLTGISNINVTPYYDNDLLIDQTGSGTCEIQGNAVNGATVFVPKGTLQIDGSSSWNLTGYLEAQNVVLNGDSGFTLTGNGPLSGATASLQQ
jgi:Flp pilus assembly protein TadG